MSYSNQVLRWTVAGRWIATIGIGIVVALGYGLFRPAHSQDRGPQVPDKASADHGYTAPAAAATEKNSPAKSSGTLTRQEILAKAAGDTSGGEPEKKDAAPVKEADSASILGEIKWLSPHMWAFYAIWLVSIVSVAYAVERFIGLRRSKILPADLAAGLRALASRKGELDLRHAQRLCKQYPSSMAVVVRAMLAKAGRPLPEIEQAMTEACEHEATRLYTNVRVQNLAFNVAPMLGLAGTVHGIILCFYSTAHLLVGQNKMDALATGIYAALICTLAGLVVAIPAGILAHYFESRILKLFQQVEDLARALVPHFERFEGRPRQPAPGDGVPGGAPSTLGPGRPPATKQPLAAAIIEMPRDDDDDLDDDDDPLPAPKPHKVEGRP
jgi:biopolymer transport protein ExbB